MKESPAIIPAMAPSLFMRLEKIPIKITGKNDEAASPKANATTCATNPGGWIPKYPAMTIARAADIRAKRSSCLSVIFFKNIFFNRSWEIDVEMTSSKPAAVERAAASPPAATKAITQFGRPAISGFARTMMSRSI